MPKKKTYSRMTKAEKRVAIAKDVIKQVKAKHYMAENMVYIETGNEDDHVNKAFFHKRKRKPCTVCAKGALVCSTVRLFNKFEGTADALYSQVESVLERNFGQVNGDMIELAFEKWEQWKYNSEKWCRGPVLDEIQILKALRFGRKYRSNTKRLIAIMENIIKNGGTFKP